MIDLCELAFALLFLAGLFFSLGVMGLVADHMCEEKKKAARAGTRHGKNKNSSFAILTQKGVRVK